MRRDMLPALALGGAVLAALALPASAIAQCRAPSGAEVAAAGSSGTVAAARADTVPCINLAEALERSVRLDPDYVQALGQIDNAAWNRRAARLAFIVPAITAGLDVTKYSTAFFNIGTGVPSSNAVTARLEARYELGVRNFPDLGATGALLESAEASELSTRFAAALETERTFYDVLAGAELTRVSEERVRRAGEALAVARARVVSGAAVQTDSLQLTLELTQARVELLRQRTIWRVAQLQLGRRTGYDRAVDAQLTDTTLMQPELPIALPEAVSLALEQGPQYRAARASERAAQSQLSGERGAYLPTLVLSAGHQRFDTQLFPNARNVSAITLGVSFPIWDNAQREIAVSQARVNRDVAQALRADLERAARADVTEAYDTYTNARAATALSVTGLDVARENYRVQDTRYRAGATDILELLNAQLRLVQSEADLVQARYANRLALAGLEAIIGRRLFTRGNAQ